MKKKTKYELRLNFAFRLSRSKPLPIVKSDHINEDRKLEASVTTTTTSKTRSWKRRSKELKTIDNTKPFNNLIMKDTQPIVMTPDGNNNNYGSTVIKNEANNNDDIMVKIDTIRDSMKDIHTSCINHTYKWRKLQLDTLVKMIKENKVEFVNALMNDLGCTYVEAQTLHIEVLLGDIAVCYTYLKHYTTPQRISSPLAMAPSFSYLKPMPLNSPGVLVIGPSNYPLSLCLQPTAGALSAGNPVIIKPSEHCPTVASVLDKYVTQYFDPSIVSVIQGTVPEITALLSKQWGLIFFTGSPSIGKIIASAAAKTLTPTVLELGGKSPCIIDPDTISTTSKLTDWLMIANRITWSKFMNSGQTCAATDTLIMSTDAYTKFESYLLQSLYNQYGTNDTLLTTQSSMGRIITHHATQRLYNMIEEVEEYIKVQDSTYPHDNGTSTKKCRIVLGGTKYCNIQEKFIAPTIIINPPFNCTIMKEEIFGPILPIITIDTRDEIYNFVNTHMPPTPLVLYIFTSCNKVYNDYTSKIRAGSIMRNDCLVQLSSPSIPFGGLGTSGYGVYHGKYTLETFTHWTPSMYRPLLSGCDLNNMRYHPFISGSMKQFLFSNLSLFPNVPPLFMKEAICCITTIIVGTILALKYAPK